jgi:hypothetical protein
MKGGEIAALMHDALAADLSKFEKTRRMPVMTKVNARLAKITGNEARTFLFTLLEGETWPGFLQSADKTGTDPRSWQNNTIHFDKEVVYDRYLQYVEREHRAKKPVSSIQFWAEIERVIGVGTIASKWTWIKPREAWQKGKYGRVQVLPSRAELRAIWDRHAGGEGEWPSESAEDDSDREENGGEGYGVDTPPDEYPEGYGGEDSDN